MQNIFFGSNACQSAEAGRLMRHGQARELLIGRGLFVTAYGACAATPQVCGQIASGYRRARPSL